MALTLFWKQTLLLEINLKWIEKVLEINKLIVGAYSKNDTNDTLNSVLIKWRLRVFGNKLFNY